MQTEIKCLRCGGKNVEPSHLQSTGKIYSRPKQTNLRGLLLTGAPVSALTCMDCGHVELLVDTKKVKALARTD